MLGAVETRFSGEFNPRIGSTRVAGGGTACFFPISRLSMPPPRDCPAARACYQKSLLLTPAQAATLKQNASQCNQALDQHQQKAQPAIAAVQAQAASSAGPFTPPPQLVALEQERTAISNTCIQNLHAALGDRKFMDIDVFVRTRFAQKVSAIPPANAPFADVPVVTPAIPGAAK